jgi:glucokinase
MPDNINHAIGLDVGGTKIAGGLVALDSGEVLARRIVPTEPQRGGEAVLATALDLAEWLLEAATAHSVEVAGIGIGVCELVDPAGKVTSGHTVEWQDLPVQERFAQLAPAVVEADVRAAALAEALYGAGRTFQHFVYVTVGTGISSCLVQEGRPWTGACGNALVLATGPITTTCPECGATVRTILEEVAAGPALVSRYNAATGADFTRGQEVVSAAEGGDAVAIEVVRRGGEALGVGVGWLVNVLDPEAIVVGGGLGVSGGLYWSSFVESTRSHVWSDESRKLPILPAQLGTDAGVIGAAAVFRERRR